MEGKVTLYIFTVHSLKYILKHKERNADSTMMHSHTVFYSILIFTYIERLRMRGAVSR